MKNKLTITLDDHDAKLFDKAIRLACRLGNAEEPQRNHRRFVLGWIIRAVSSAIIHEGQMPATLAVELREETPEETRQRLEKEIPASPQELRRIPPPNPWN